MGLSVILRSASIDATKLKNMFRDIMKERIDFEDSVRISGNSYLIN